MKDGSKTPSALQISETGQLSATVDTIPKQLAFSVRVTSFRKGFGKKYDQIVDGIVITTKCGPLSTTVTPIELQTQDSFADLSTEMVFSGEFKTSNPNCPISYELTGSQFEFTEGPPFLIKLKQAFRNKPDSYSYTLKATPKGGKPVDKQGQMIVSEGCQSSVLQSFKKTPFTQFVKSSGSEDVVLINSGADYTIAPSKECTQTFSIQMKDGSPVPQYLKINTKTGQLSAKVGTSKFTAEFTISVGTQRSEESIIHVLRIDGLSFSLVCGPESTIITPTELTTQSSYADLATPMQFSGKFGTTNDQCPVVYSLEDG